MNRMLIKKCLAESWLLHAACGSMLFVFCWTRVWIVCQFDLQKFQPLLEQFRMFERFIPVPLEQLLTYPGAIGMCFSEPVLILCILVWSIARGSDVVSGELSRGTLEMLLAQPIGRTRLMLTHSLVCIAGLASLCLMAWLGIYVGIHSNTIVETHTTSAAVQLPFLPIEIPIAMGPTIEQAVPLSSRVSPSLYAPTTFNLFALGFFVLCLSTLLSSLDRYRWRTIGLAIGIYVVQLLIMLLSKASPAFRWAENFTFFSCYQPDGIVNYAQKHPTAAWGLLSPAGTQSAAWTHVLGPLGLSLLMIALGSVLLIASVVIFQRRDLPTPI